MYKGEPKRVRFEWQPFDYFKKAMANATMDNVKELEIKDGITSAEDVEIYANLHNSMPHDKGWQALHISTANIGGHKFTDADITSNLSQDRNTLTNNFNGVIRCIKRELNGATKKFPGNEHTMVALTEEVGELAQALLQLDHEGTKTADDVFKEAIQVATMAIKLALKGDHGFSYKIESVVNFKATGEK